MGNRSDAIPGLATDREPFERQPKESSKAWAAFVIYRDGGHKRSQAKTGEKLSKSRAVIGAWSTRWRWVERVSAWDSFLDDQARAAQVAEVKEMQARHINLSKLMQSVGAHQLVGLNDLVRHGKPIDLKVSDARRLIATGVQIERLNRGEPIEIRRNLTAIDIDEKTMRDLSDEQIERLLSGEDPETVVEGISKKKTTSR